MPSKRTASLPPTKNKTKKKAARKARRKTTPKAPAQHSAEAQMESFVPDAVDRELAIRAMRKRKAGQEPTARETVALQRESVRRSVRAIPQKIWREMSQRQTKVINEQAERYGLPFGGATVDLYALVPALHNFLARNKHRLAASPQSDDPMMLGDVTPAIERYRDERARIVKLDRLERESVLVDAEGLREHLDMVASLLRSCGEKLERKYGRGAHDLLIETLDEAEAKLMEKIP